jgi:hypothetical protein
VGPGVRRWRSRVPKALSGGESKLKEAARAAEGAEEGVGEREEGQHVSSMCSERGLGHQRRCVNRRGKRVRREDFPLKERRFITKEK